MQNRKGENLWQSGCKRKSLPGTPKLQERSARCKSVEACRGCDCLGIAVRETGKIGLK